MFDEFQSSLVISMMPELLLSDLDEKSLRLSSAERCSAVVNLCSKSTMECCGLHQQCSEVKKTHLNKCRNLKEEIEELKKETIAQESERNKLMKQIANIKESIKVNKQNGVTNDEELSLLMQKLAILRQEIEHKKEEIIHDVKSFEMGIFYYKKFLQCNVISVGKNELLFTFNTSAKSASDASHFIRFTTPNNGLTFQYVEMYPKLKKEQKLIDRFHKTGDIQGLILSFWKAVKNLREK
uniref:Kinetochore protein SPC25 n=1 Tax=Cuerna arida TaxID=1464854 RepID=A0A1B6ENS9_9HEMI